MILLLDVIIIFEQFLHSIGELVGAQLRTHIRYNAYPYLKSLQPPTMACEALKLFMPAVINC